MKEKDALKVGRFGLGFKSLFHLTGRSHQIIVVLNITRETSDDHSKNLDVLLCCHPDSAQLLRSPLKNSSYSILRKLFGKYT